MEPPCRICTRLTSPVAFNPRTLENRYKSPVTRRREYCEPRRCNAKVGTDLRSELDSRSYNVDRVVDKIQELRRKVQDLDGSKRDKRKAQQTDEPLPDARIIDLKNIHNAVDNCLRELGKIKTFLKSENSWWKLLKARTIDCCQQKLPHLHGVLDGSPVTLMLLEEETDQLPRHFVIIKSQKRSDDTSSKFETSSRELESGQFTGPWKKRIEEYSDTIPYYRDTKSTLIDIASTDEQEPSQQYTTRATASKQNIAASEFWIKVQRGRSDEEKIPDRSPRSKETQSDKIEFQDKKKKTDRLNVVPSREIWYGQNTQTMFEDRLKPRETFSSENTGSKKLAVTADFESNVDLKTEFSSRNMANHKPRTKPINEKDNHTQKTPTKISKTKIRD